MPIVTERDGEVRGFTFMEGLLSAIAHDLEIRVERFRIEWDDAGSKVTATFDPKSLRVAHALVRGAPSPSSLSHADLAKIAENIQREVLGPSAPEVRFESTSIEGDGESRRITGTLALHGRSRALTTTATRSGAHWATTVTLDQRDFGIKPYSAMLGTLKIKPEIRVELRLPA